MKLDVIYIAKIIIETATPLRVGAGEQGILVDSLVARDVNDLPYIPGTSLAGVIRHELSNRLENKSVIDALFGSPGKHEGSDPIGTGSRIILSDAQLLGSKEERVHEGLMQALDDDPYYTLLRRLPERDHVRINEQGVAMDTGKYEEELVPKGVRFVFEMELHGTKEDETHWKDLLKLIHQDFFRIGAGTRKGFGQLAVVDCRHRQFFLENETDMIAYLDRSSSLNEDTAEWRKFDDEVQESGSYYHYRIKLEPELFFLFGAGVGNDEVNAEPKREYYFSWEDGRPHLQEEEVLIPATSVKGALSHRVAFHYNRLTKEYIEKVKEIDLKDMGLEFDPADVIKKFDFATHLTGLLEPDDPDSDEWEDLENRIRRITVDEVLAWKEFEAKVKSQRNFLSGKKDVNHTTGPNHAVQQLFGVALDEDTGARGKVIFSDLYLPKENVETKVLAHVKIDRFTGGGIDGALYAEEVVKSNTFYLDFFVEKSAFDGDNGGNIKKAFEAALDDLKSGRLPLGGHTTKGHGAFKGDWTIVNANKATV